MFNYGRVKIVDVDGIMYGNKHWDNGDEVIVIAHTSMALLVESKKQIGTYVITEEEIGCVEFIDWALPDNKESIISKAKKEKEEQRKSLLLEQDYFLASLYDAIQVKDEVGRKEYNAELTRIHAELEALK